MRDCLGLGRERRAQRSSQAVTRNERGAGRDDRVIGDEEQVAFEQRERLDGAVVPEHLERADPDALTDERRVLRTWQEDDVDVANGATADGLHRCLLSRCER